MHELTVLASPSTLPCSTSGTTAGASSATLQLVVTNTSQAPVDVTNSALKITLPVDPGGDGSASALVLSNASTDPSVTSPNPVQAIQATATSGTAWSITPAPDGTPGVFLAMPNLTGSPVILAPQDVLSFQFGNLLVDEVPGAAAITVTVLPEPPGGSLSTSGPVYVAKTPAGFGITAFGASSLLVPQGGEADLTWSTVGVGSCGLSWYPAGGASVTRNGTPLSTPATGLPTQVDGTEPVKARIDAQTQFTLTARGSEHAISEELVVDVMEPALHLSASTLLVLPGERFVLTWSSYDTPSAPILNWTSDQGQGTVIDNATQRTLDPGTQVAAVGSATVQILGPTEFSLGISGPGGESATTLVGVVEARIDDARAEPASYTAPLPGGQLGPLVVTTTNATSVFVTGRTGTQAFPIDHPQLGTPATQTLDVVDSTRSGTYTVLAQGYRSPGSRVPGQRQVQVIAYVSLYSFVASPPSIYDDSHSTLQWTSYAATGFTLSDNRGHSWELGSGTTSFDVTPPRGTTMYTLVAHGDVPGGATEPALTATVLVTIRKTKEKEHVKDNQAEKIKGRGVQEESYFPGVRSADSAASSNGTQRAFIAPAERPQPAPAATQPG